MHSPGHIEVENTASVTNRRGQKRPRISETDVAAEEKESSPAAGSSSGKRRRRKLSCETCQRRKCRCDYDPIERTCHRCRTLRLHCSFSDDDSLIRAQGTNSHHGIASLEERLQKFEASIVEIKSALHDVQLNTRNDKQADTTSSLIKPKTNPSFFESSSNDVEPENVSHAVDAGIGSAPALVIREVTRQLTGGHRRLLEHINIDLINQGLLDEYTANELLRLFCRHRGQGLLVHDINDPLLGQHLRKSSPFLHSVCCLNGLVYRSDGMPGSQTGREIYEQVRLALGQALLASPLPLEDINAILLLSIYSNNSPTLGSQIDYIDSWMLTGYVAQQAILAISFSGIVDNVKRGCSTNADRNAIRLWANICLHHLHWAATTGRPPTIPSPYLNQCNMLLNVFQPTVQEEMVLAEILLYSIVNRKLARHSYLDSKGECEEFTTWRQRWAHLFALPKSSSLKLSYHAAYFILAVRSLEDFSDGQCPEELLSPEATETPTAYHQMKALSKHETHAMQFAVNILETFLEIATSCRDGVPVYLYMCISYSALVIAQYWREDSAKVSRRTILDLLLSLEDWCAGCPNVCLSMGYVAGLARRRVQGTVSNDTRLSGDDVVSQNSSERSQGAGTPLHYAAEGLLGLGGFEAHSQPSSIGLVISDLPDLDLTQSFPTMEDFFGGGFLDFMR